MRHVSIKPQWTIQWPGEQTLPARLVDLLTQVHRHGSLSNACKEAGTSYRHAWDLIRQGEALFGAPLLAMERGKGSRLTALGGKLVWADQRVAARLAPVLASLASELESEIDSVLQTERVMMRVHASHGFAIETLLDFMARRGIAVERKYCSSLEAPAALHDGACDLAGFHIPIGELEGPALQHYSRWLEPTRHRVIDIATRRQGLMVAAGNPLKIYGLADLLRPEVRFINRQRQSGTRFLLECLLGQAGLDADRINGFEQGEFTHAAVAAFVASSMADVGFGIETPARRFKLDFIALAQERYFLMCHAAAVDQPVVAELLETLRSPEFRAAVDELPGYDARHAGRVQGLDEAFPGLAAGVAPADA
jgi:molybdate transport repressor ModE-like protein